DCLRHFFDNELVCEFKCHDCNNLGKLKQTCISRTSPALILHLKRFDNQGDKLSCPIKFQETLNMNDFCNHSQSLSSSYEYLLYAVVVHYDINVASGHYVIYIKMNEKKWIKINDSEIADVEVEQVLSERQNAYLLAYIQKSFIMTEQQQYQSQIEAGNKQQQSSKNEHIVQQQPKSSERYKCQNHGFGDTPVLVRHSQNIPKQRIPRLRQDIAPLYNLKRSSTNFEQKDLPKHDSDVLYSDDVQ
ncbi:unnamed protein product, partial [Didymodactylos carnosus]